MPSAALPYRRASLTMSGARRRAASPYASLRGLRVEEGTTNIAKYASMVTGPGTGWVALGGATVTFPTNTAAVRGYVANVVCVASNDGVQGSGVGNFGAITGGTTYTLSVYLNIAVGETVTLQWNDYDGGGGFLSAHSAACGGTGARTRYTVTAAAHASGVSANAFAYSASGAQTFTADGWQLEAKGYATTYCDGSLGLGYAWTGTANASTSTRTVTRASMPAASVLTGGLSSFAFVVAVTMGQASTAFANGTYPRLLDATIDGSNSVLCYFDATADTVYLQRTGGGVTVTSNGVAVTWAAGDTLVFYFGGDASAIELAISTVSAGAINTPKAATAIPSGTLTHVYVGTDASLGSVLDGVFGAVATFNRRLTQAEVTAFMALTRPPAIGELVGNANIGVWVGSKDYAYTNEEAA